MDEQRAVERLLHAEARLLDERRYDEWLALYAADCEYWVPASPEQDNPLDHVSLFHEDRILMETRVRRLQHRRAHSLIPPVRTSRLVGNVEVTRGEGPDLLADSTFHLVEFRGGEQRLLAGRYRHRVRVDGAHLRIVSKRVDLINCDAPLEVLQVFL